MRREGIIGLRLVVAQLVKELVRWLAQLKELVKIFEKFDWWLAQLSDHIVIPL